MDGTLLQFGTTAFVMLIVVVNPFAVAPVFVALTAGMTARERRSILNRAVATSFVVALFFLFFGPMLLSYLGVTVDAFAISGGVLLFVIAFRMLFAQRSPVAGRDPNDDVAVFPLAVPQLIGPGTIATILVLSTQAGRDPYRMTVLTIIVACVYLISWPTLFSAERLMGRLGEGRVQVITRVLGIILAALAAQYVLNGVAGFISSVARRTN